MRLAVIDFELCKPENCFICQRVCPVNRKGEECITSREHIIRNVKKNYPKIDETLCIGCGICVKKCPYKAISIVNTPEKLEEKPIHRFGENEFILFRLPVPIRGVVGLLGPNGVGKTTALKILSGQLNPNLGDFEETKGMDEIIRIHRGTELQNYLEKLFGKEITTVLKPQQISLLPYAIKKTVGELINTELMKKLELQTSSEKTPDQLSGGELQRLAIGLALSKDVDMYYFDEPTSYLDVKQRLNIAKMIRKLAEEKYVMVVEHDLATLDFLADTVHIFYGQPGVYGIVSKPYSVRKGINTYLSGFIVEDNVRIREPIVFERPALPEQKTKRVLVQFEDIEKRLGNFTLKIPHGEIFEGETLGVFGSNALGKTTFARILANEIKTEGKMSGDVKISYKPQYLTSDFQGTVHDIISTVISPNTTEFKHTFGKPLGLENLMERDVSNLSGGELQRVAIVLCLSRKADLYLLDEPSAYLDIEQRLAVAKVIRNVGTSLVIDHDLLFLSYIADRAMLFYGTPGIRGSANFYPLEQGFNEFLKNIGVTFRSDPETKRPRANKLGSVKDREQKEKGEYFRTS
jgi:ATP-binding cassette subfamily E protein 1